MGSRETPVEQVLVRPYDEIELERLIELHSTYYPHEHAARSIEYLEWLYLRNPFGKGLVTCVVGDDGSYWASMGAIPFRIQMGSREVHAFSVVNVLVHPLQRSRNLFVKMIRALSAALAAHGGWLMGHPNEAAYPGWKRTKMCFKPGARLAIAIGPMWRTRSGTIVEIRRSEQLDALGYEPLCEWRRVMRQPMIAADAAYLRWRFLEHPINRYCVRLRAAADNVVAYEASRRLKPFVRLVVDWQGDEPWQDASIGARFLPRLIAWPEKGCGMPSKPLVLGLPPPLQRRYRFFATPCGGPAGDETVERDWALTTLAVSDFV